MNIAAGMSNLSGLVDLGGPVVALLLLMSVVAVAVILYKIAQFLRLGVGSHAGLAQASVALDRGARAEAGRLAAESRSHLAPVFADLLGRRDAVSDMAGLRARIEAEAAERLDRLERGFRLLDSIAQIAPLLGLFGTVLGMIDAFQALQDAGSNVDPSVLAGGIWVALMTTAAGLAVAMPTALALSWLETRAEAERAFADGLVARMFCPVPERETAPRPPAASVRAAHAG
jgi:biopolymer transport protein ExbB